MNKLQLWTWCFPQMLLGFLVKVFTKARKVGDHYEWDIEVGSMSLGEYIFLCPYHYNDEETLKHEFGHTIQSRRLGWLYLLVIALPSIIWAGCFEWLREKYNISYYAFYTEKWADELAGIVRTEENQNGE